LFFENSTETEYLFKKKTVEKQHIRRGKKQKQLENKNKNFSYKKYCRCAEK